MKSANGSGRTCNINCTDQETQRSGTDFAADVRSAGQGLASAALEEQDHKQTPLVVYIIMSEGRTVYS